MTLLAYPRLPNGETQIIRNRMVEIAAQDPALLSDLVGTSHPTAQPVPTGARVADENHIAHLREAVIDDMRPWLTPGAAVPRARMAEFDRELGSSLHRNLQIIPADAGHDTTWNFLSAVVFPDVVWARYPDLHIDRVQGKRHRNTLRRAWFRHTVIGDLQASNAKPLGEDEMTGLFERPTLAMNNRLIRLLAQMILEYPDANRMEYTRNLTKRAIALTGTYLLDSLSHDELHELIAPDSTNPLARVAGTEMKQRADGSQVSSDDAHPSPESTQMHQSAHTGLSTKSLRQESGDLVTDFHRAMVRLCNRINAETGYRPTALFGMISRIGGVEAARAVVGDARPSEAFTWLWEHDRGDLTVEALVLQEEYRGLFTEALLDRAADRINATF